MDHMSRADQVIADHTRNKIIERGPTSDTPLVEFDGPLWRSPILKRWIRIRGLSDPGYQAIDWSYAYAELVNGAVILLHSCGAALPLAMQDASNWGRKRGWKGRAIAEAKRHGVYLKGTGLLQAADSGYHGW